MWNSLLITGGAGFVGSNLSLLFKEKYPDREVIAMDNLKRRGSEMNVPTLKRRGVSFVHGDIRCVEDFPDSEADVLIECSAEPSVLASYYNPMFVLNTNLTGTINCLEWARKRKLGLVFISTSRVYPYAAINKIEYDEHETRFVWKEGQKSTRGWSIEGISEEFPLDGARTIYGTSKLCSELIIQEYIDMGKIKGVINRCGVIAGPGQFGKVDQGVFTLWMLHHYFKKDSLRYIGYNGTGKQVRDLLHIRDLFELIELQLEKLDSINGQVFNVGGGKRYSLSLLETTNLCREITGNTIKIGKELEERPGDVRIYIGDNSKIQQTLQWRPRIHPEKVLEDIFFWIRENEKELRQLVE